VLTPVNTGNQLAALPHLIPFKTMVMVKRSKDEPADKAAERLKQMLDARRPVPEKNKQEEEAPDDKPEKKPAKPEGNPDDPGKNKDA
jgi:hypothetical protein